MYLDLNEEFLAYLLDREYPEISFYHSSIRNKTVLITGAGGSELR
jgi:FlaA1/EpsC-like NDP-sugar epimerase